MRREARVRWDRMAEAKDSRPTNVSIPLSALSSSALVIVIGHHLWVSQSSWRVLLAVAVKYSVGINGLVMFYQ